MGGYVFRDGPDGLEFVGDFEGLYRNDADPWGQSGGDDRLGDYYAESRQRLVEALWRHQAGNNLLEIGCGHGHLSARLNESVSPFVTGLDISETAIESARARYPKCRFIVGDITDPSFSLPRKFDVVVFAQCLWYVLRNLDTAILNGLRCLNDRGLLVVSQAFLREQRFGKEVVNGFRGAVLRLVQRHDMDLIEARYTDHPAITHPDGLLIFRKAEHAD